MPTVYAAMEDTLVVVQDATGDPETAQALAGHDLQCVAASFEAPARVFVGTFDAGLQRSVDGAASFERVGARIESDAVMAVTVSPHDPDVVWAGTEPSAIYRSGDGGDTWEERPGLTDLPSAGEWYFPPRPHTHHVRWIELDPTDPDRLYVGIEAGALVLSDDGGETWRERPPGSRRDNHSLATHPDAPGRVFAAAGDGYAESTDGGETFGHPEAGLDHRYCWSVVPDPNNPDAVVLSSASGPRAAHSPPGTSYVYRRDDGAWERVTGLPTGEGVLRAVLADGADGVYAVTNRGIHRSADVGRSWDGIEMAWPDRFLTQAPAGLTVV